MFGSKLLLAGALTLALFYDAGAWAASATS